jgi:alkylation response protein AidB-like acyl-CoA dehydrogenase
MQFKLAQMATDLEASRLMVRHGARMITEKVPNYTMYCAMAKQFATDKCWHVVNDCL